VRRGGAQEDDAEEAAFSTARHGDSGGTLLVFSLISRRLPLCGSYFGGGRFGGGRERPDGRKRGGGGRCAH